MKTRPLSVTLGCFSLLFILSLFSRLSFAIEKQQADLIVFGDYLVTMDGEQPVIKNGAVVIKENNILAVGARSDILNTYQATEQINGKNRILMPGLINGHTHSAMTLFRGMADDLELMPWLNNFIFPMEGQFVDPDFIKTGTQLACWEMIRGGTTTFVDMYFYPQVIAQQVDDCGLRAIIASPSIDYPSPGFKGWDDSFKAAVEFVKQWQGKNERITPAFAPHAPYTVSPKHIKEVAIKARELNAPVSIHLAESAAELTMIKDRYNTTPIKHVANLGLLRDITLIGAHMVHPNDEEISLLAKKNIGAIHNPTSNLKLATGISPVVKMLENDVLVGLGTDGAASNNDLDLWEDMRLAALIHKTNVKDPTALPALTALKMATSMGAQAIGMGDITGKLKAGMRADMIQVSLDDLRLAPLYDVISHLVYVVDSNDVVTSIVSGKLLMKNAQVMTIDEKQLRIAVESKSLQISKALAKTIK